MAETQPKQVSYGRAQMSDDFVKKIWAQLDQFRKDEAARKDLERRIRRYEERRRRNERDKRRQERLEAQKKKYEDSRNRRRSTSPQIRASHSVHSSRGGTVSQSSDRRTSSRQRHEHRNQERSAREKCDGERGKQHEDRPQHYRRRSRSHVRSVTRHASRSHSSRNEASRRSGGTERSRSRHHVSNRDSQDRRHHRHRAGSKSHETHSPHVHHSGHSSRNTVSNRNDSDKQYVSSRQKNSDESIRTEKDHGKDPRRHARRGFDHPPRFTRRRIPPPRLIQLPLLSSKNEVSSRDEQDENEDSSNIGVVKKPFSFDINMDTRRVRLTYGQALFCELNENEEDPNKYYNLNWM